MLKNKVIVLGTFIDKNLEFIELVNIFKNNDYLNKIIVTPNPEILVYAYKNIKYRKLLNYADYSIADGIGLVVLARLFNKKIKRITGADLVKELLDIVDNLSLKVLILNWQGGLASASQIKSEISKIYPNIHFTVLDIERNEKDYFRKLEKYKNEKFDLVLSALGFPYQEKYLLKHKNLINYKLAIACGGSVDFIIGVQKRAPLIWRKIGLEWLYRWLQAPIRRSKRMFNALFVFPFYFLQWKFSSKFLYRKNVIICIYNDKNEFLLVRKYYDPKISVYELKDDWEILQGGIDKGEKVEEAVIREVQEELGIENFHQYFKIMKITDFLWKYTWDNEELRELKFYKGQKQRIAFVKLVNNDVKFNLEKEAELDDYKWLKKEDVLDRVSEKRREKTKIVLDLFDKYINKKE